MCVQREEAKLRESLAAVQSIVDQKLEERRSCVEKLRRAVTPQVMKNLQASSKLSSEVSDSFASSSVASSVSRNSSHHRGQTPQCHHQHPHNTATSLSSSAATRDVDPDEFVRAVYAAQIRQQREEGAMKRIRGWNERWQQQERQTAVVHRRVSSSDVKAPSGEFTLTVLCEFLRTGSIETHVSGVKSPYDLLHHLARVVVPLPKDHFVSDVHLEDMANGRRGVFLPLCSVDELEAAASAVRCRERVRVKAIVLKRRIVLQSRSKKQQATQQR